MRTGISAFAIVVAAICVPRIVLSQVHGNPIEIGTGIDASILTGRHWHAEGGIGGTISMGFPLGSAYAVEVAAGMGRYGSQQFSVVPEIDDGGVWYAFWAPRIDVEAHFRGRPSSKVIRPILGIRGSWTRLEGNSGLGVGMRAGLRWMSSQRLAVDFGVLADLVHISDPQLFFSSPWGTKTTVFARVVTFAF